MGTLKISKKSSLNGINTNSMDEEKEKRWKQLEKLNLIERFEKLNITEGLSGWINDSIADMYKNRHDM